MYIKLLDLNEFGYNAYFLSEFKIISVLNFKWDKVEDPKSGLGKEAK